MCRGTARHAAVALCGPCMERHCCDIINVYVLKIYSCLIRINFNSGKSSFSKTPYRQRKIITNAKGEWSHLCASCSSAFPFHIRSTFNFCALLVMAAICDVEYFHRWWYQLPSLRTTKYFASLWKCLWASVSTWNGECANINCTHSTTASAAARINRWL